MVERKAQPPSAARKTGSGIMGLKIAKNSFVFTSRKRFKYLREFKPQQKLEGIDLVRKLVTSGIQTIRQPGSQSKGRAAASADASQKITLPPYVFKALLIAGGLLVLLFVAFAIWIMSLASSPALLQPAQPAAASFVLSPVYSAIVPYGLENLSIALASFKSEASGMRQLNATISAYSFPVPSRVVLLRTGRQQPKAMADFESSLSSLLRQDMAPPERLHIDQLRHAPPGFAIYILAS
ncbi:MAG: hypothetical protein WC759_03730, partial [Candidatus Micrarchaeia archaeon]